MPTEKRGVIQLPSFAMSLNRLAAQFPKHAELLKNVKFYENPSLYSPPAH